MTADDLAAAFQGLPAPWREVLPDWTPERCADVVNRVRAVSGARPIGPADPFRALRLVAPEAVKVVVFGQDPYPTAGHADGLAFSAGAGKPASLRRIFAVLEKDRPGFVRPARWSLDPWARQGVLLLNPTLTVEIGAIGSHLNCGWQALTSEIVRVLASRESPPTFLLWGSKAQTFFDESCPARLRPPVLRTRHPSNDFKRAFMADGSHFTATSGLVDWWSLGAQPV
jgi:uracil-DNA glycosylase